MAPKIVPLLPHHRCYVEPFAGGLAVLFTKGKPAGSRNRSIEVINDKSEDLINLYRVMQDRESFEELQHRLNYTLHSRLEHKRAREILKSDNDDQIDRAWAYFVAINGSFANHLGAGFRFSTVRNESAKFSAKTNVDKLRAIHERLKFVQIECDDAIKVIERFDSSHTCFYCDPPYPGAEQGHYGGYTMDDFLNLCETLNNIKGSFVLSNYPQEIPDYGWDRFEFQASMSAARDKSTNKQRTEVVWRKVSEWAMERGERTTYQGGMFA